MASSHCFNTLPRSACNTPAPQQRVPFVILTSSSEFHWVNRNRWLSTLSLIVDLSESLLQDASQDQYPLHVLPLTEGGPHRRMPFVQHTSSSKSHWANRNCWHSFLSLIVSLSESLSRDASQNHSGDRSIKNASKNGGTHLYRQELSQQWRRPLPSRFCWSKQSMRNAEFCPPPAPFFRPLPSPEDRGGGGGSRVRMSHE